MMIFKLSLYKLISILLFSMYIRKTSAGALLSSANKKNEVNVIKIHVRINLTKIFIFTNIFYLTRLLEFISNTKLE